MAKYVYANEASNEPNQGRATLFPSWHRWRSRHSAVEHSPHNSVKQVPVAAATFWSSLLAPLLSGAIPLLPLWVLIGDCR